MLECGSARSAMHVQTVFIPKVIGCSCAMCVCTSTLACLKLQTLLCFSLRLPSLLCLLAEADARRLLELLADVYCMVNLIVFNPHEGTRFQRSEDEQVSLVAHREGACTS